MFFALFILSNRSCFRHGDINSWENPKQIEGLAGLKIIDIGSGSYHSVAISSFGDAYSWGWNTNGQLGLHKITQNSLENVWKSEQQVFTTPQLIEFEDSDAISNVYCGAKHTLLRTDRNRIFSSGLNNYGQLGLSSIQESVDNFTEVPLKDVDQETKIFCGYWSTFLLNSL